MTADFFSLFLRNIEYSDKAFPIYQLERSQDFEWVITCAQFHNVKDSLFFFGGSNGTINMGDMRANSNPSKTVSTFYVDSKMKDFKDIFERVIDFGFSQDGQQLLVRQLNRVNVYDVRKTETPVDEISICENFNDSLDGFFKKENFWPKFNISMSCKSKHFITGFFDDTFLIYDQEKKEKSFMQIKDKQLNIFTEQNPFSQKFTKFQPVNHVLYNPDCDSVAVGISSEIFFIHKKQIN